MTPKFSGIRLKKRELMRSVRSVRRIRDRADADKETAEKLYSACEEYIKKHAEF